MISGIIDFHVHSSPSLVPRHTDDPQTLAAANAVGVDLLVLKSHEGSTAERAALLGPAAIGGIVLNSCVGGANPDAVAVAARLGARVVWMPTVCSRAHRAAAGDGDLAVHAPLEFAEVAAVDTDGALLAAWHPVLEEVAHHDLVLASGHLTMDETLVVFREAARRGVRRFLVNHPGLRFLDWRNEHAREFANMDVHLEVGVLADRVLGPDGLTTERLAEAYPAELLVFGSDLGHAAFPTLQDGIEAWIANSGLSDSALEAIMTRNGRTLLGL